MFEKMVIEYEGKIKTCDEKLTEIKGAISVARNAADEGTRQDLVADRREWAAKRQAYVQALADIKSLFGEI